MSGYLLLCPGQGAQHPAMLGFALATTEGTQAIAEAAESAGIDIAKRVLAGDDLFEPVFAQVCMVTAAMATWRSLARWLPAPAAFAGYSVGEVASWGCAGTWSVAESIAIVKRRAQFMVDASPPGCSMMAVTGITQEVVEHALGNDVHVAIEVEADHWIVAGRRADVEKAGEAMAAAGACLHPLPVSVPSHTPLLSNAAESLRQVLKATPGREPQAPVLRGIDGRALFARADAADALADAVSKPIRWRAVLQEASERGLAIALELPPGAGLTKMFRNTAGVDARAVADFRSVEGVARWIERAL